MTKPNNRGVALIVAVVTAVIFMMLVITVVVVSMSTYKKSGQGHDRAMALNLAEAGINDALYQMNYRYYNETVLRGATYPLNLQYLNFSYVPATDTLWQTLPNPPNPYNSFGLGLSNGYIVQALTTGVANTDKIHSTGIYNGKRRVVSINIRGTNAPGVALSDPASGIAEAFNKHAVYANIVQRPVVSGPTVTGNIVYVADPIPLNILPDIGTKTKLDPALFEIPDSTALTTALPVPVRIYTDGNRPGGTGDGITTWDFIIDSYGTYDGGVYTFTSNPLLGTNIEFHDGPIGGVPTVNINSLTAINSSIKTSGEMTVSAVAPGITITGDLIVTGTLSLNGPITVTGNVLCNSDITVGNLGGLVIISGLLYTHSASGTAVTIGNIASNDVTINGTVVAGGTVTLNKCTITWNKTPFIDSIGSMYDNFNFTDGRRVYLPVPGSWREE